MSKEIEYTKCEGKLIGENEESYLFELDNLVDGVNSYGVEIPKLEIKDFKILKSKSEELYKPIEFRILKSYLNEIRVAIHDSLAKEEITEDSMKETKKESEKKHMDRDWLFHQYVELNKTMTEIGKICKRDPSTIQYWMEKFNIPRRHSSKKEEFIELEGMICSEDTEHGFIDIDLEVNTAIQFPMKIIEILDNKINPELEYIKIRVPRSYLNEILKQMNLLERSEENKEL